MQGTVLLLDVQVGDDVAQGQRVAILESMKMEHEISTSISGTVEKLLVEVGETILEGQELISLVPKDISQTGKEAETELDLDHIRDDLAEVKERHDIGLDHRRPDAVAKRRRREQRTARENIADLLNLDSYIEYGPLVVAPQRKRRTVEDLILNTPADGMIAGIGEVNADIFSEEKAQCVVMSYDYTVLAGTQGGQNHRKKDRLFEIAKRMGESSTRGSGWLEASARTSQYLGIQPTLPCRSSPIPRADVWPIAPSSHGPGVNDLRSWLDLPLRFPPSDLGCFRAQVIVRQ